MAAGYKMRLVTGGGREHEDPVNVDETTFGVEVIGDGGNVAVVTVFGQADLHTAPELRSAISEAIDGGAHALVIDLSDLDFVAGELSVADFAILGWAWRHPRHKVDLADFPNVKRWYDALMARPAVKRGMEAKLD